ncbi:hypothetical protein SISSUDRAFT_823919 [Sistotremastrum suecicum HHB10207 ss-3]|uniref:Uncharacterized protein n=1 Tax=Sistotremastrum suecicum HHB10207 ss-3 TaxID=1314776 RepID=A0A166CRH5_9AGAM|nr:hypothetical protein SISSUDRAFT_823919 [Sistotremastrum suecicum HHB10207 ss-3]
MVKNPVTAFAISKSYLIAASGVNVYALSLSSGGLLHESTSASSSIIRYVKINEGEEAKHVVACGDDKKLLVWRLSESGLEELDSRELPKKPTCLQLTAKGQKILVADKFGDVFSYPLLPPEQPSTSTPSTQKGGHASSHGTLILGHTSILTELILVERENRPFIVTADRDEHIRISRYPQGFIVHRYCLGSTRFVSSLCDLGNGQLLSGGGEDVLRVWEWDSGECLRTIDVGSSVKPSIVVRRTLSGGEDEEDGRDKKKKKPKGASTKIEASPSVQTEPTLVIRRISKVLVDSKSWIIFGAVGATALFYFPWQKSSQGQSPIETISFALPVLDFIALHDGRLLVSLDSNHAAKEEEPSLQLLKWEQEKLVKQENDSTIQKLENRVRSYDGPSIGDQYELLSTLPKFSIEGQPADGVEDDVMMGVDLGGRSGEKREARQKLREALSRTQGVEETGPSKKAKLDEKEDDDPMDGDGVES